MELVLPPFSFLFSSLLSSPFPPFSSPFSSLLSPFLPSDLSIFYLLLLFSQEVLLEGIHQILHYFLYAENTDVCGCPHLFDFPEGMEAGVQELSTRLREVNNIYIYLFIYLLYNIAQE